MSSIRTLVFLDLESTHLPKFVPPFGPSRITEIALLACRLRQFKRPYRVTDKLSLCVRPPENVCAESAHITGLDNYNLEEQPLFGEAAVVLRSFLVTLDQPICLVAHNGSKFDFPLLRAELVACGASWDDLDLRVCDSLEAFRYILPRLSEDHFALSAAASSVTVPLDSSLDKKQVSHTSTEYKNSLTSSSNSSQLEPQPPGGLCTPPKNPKYDRELDSTLTSEPRCANDPLETKCLEQRPALDPDAEGETANLDAGRVTPPRSEQAPRPNHPPNAPRKKCLFQRGALLFERAPNGKLEPRKISYKLSDVFERMYQQRPADAHHALVDCEMLFKCCLMIRRELMQFLETRQPMQFSDIKPMWPVRPRKMSPECSASRCAQAARQELSQQQSSNSGVNDSLPLESNPVRPHETSSQEVPTTPCRSGRKLVRRIIDAEPDESIDEKTFSRLDNDSSDIHETMDV